MEIAERFRTSEAARRLGVHPQTLRSWERKGVIEPAVRQRGQRVYTELDLQRIRSAVIEQPLRTTDEGVRIDQRSAGNVHSPSSAQEADAS